tara:strand:+ start:713 stop:1015 length:303 start_codon:yes stop_codon:yes gene_type:complete
MPTGTLTLRSDLDRKLTITEMDDNLILLSSSFSYRQNILDSTGSYIVSHSLNENYPVVIVWETGSAGAQVVVPESIISNNTNTVTVNFADEFNGHIIVKV